jgi:hypothetical protein
MLTLMDFFLLRIDVLHGWQINTGAKKNGFYSLSVNISLTNPYILECFIVLAYTAAIFVKLWSQLSEKVSV